MLSVVGDGTMPSPPRMIMLTSIVFCTESDTTLFAQKDVWNTIIPSITLFLSLRKDMSLGFTFADRGSMISFYIIPFVGKRSSSFLTISF